MIATLKNNIRDIIVGVLSVVLFAAATDFATYLALEGEGRFATLVASLQGFSYFFAANICGWFGLAVAWPVINRYSNESAMAVFKDHLNAKERFAVFLVVAVVMFLGACICFSP